MPPPTNRHLSSRALRALTPLGWLAAMCAVLGMLSPVLGGDAPDTGATGGFKDADALNRWITYYYTNPEPGRVAPALRLMSDIGVLDNADAQSGLIGFLSGVFKQNERELPIWVGQLDTLKPAHLRFVWKVIRMSGANTAEPILNTRRNQATGDERAYLQSLLDNEPIDLMKFPVLEPSMLDALWGRFSATGDRSCVEKVVGVLHWATADDNPRRQAIGRAAQWSLASNAAQHGKVLDICRELARRRDHPAAELLAEIVRDAERADE